jgi:hypothetical protein
MGAAAHAVEVGAGLLRITRLAQDFVIEDDVGVAGNDEAVALDGLGLAAGVLDYEVLWVAIGQLLDSGHDDLELDPQLLQYLPPLRRPGCEDYLQG